MTVRVLTNVFRFASGVVRRCCLAVVTFYQHGGSAVYQRLVVNDVVCDVARRVREFSR